MRKIALVFVLAVFVPSLVLAWLAVRSLRDQQFLLERQRSLLYQGISDAVAKDVQDAIAGCQSSFTAQTGKLLLRNQAAALTRSFDETLRKEWSLAQVGFVVSLNGEILAPQNTRTEARHFLVDNGGFFANRESVEVYSNPKQAPNLANLPGQTIENNDGVNALNYNRQQRNVLPQQQVSTFQSVAPQPEAQQQSFSKSIAAAAEFRQLIGEAAEGTMARFVNNKLNMLFWCRPAFLPLPTPKSAKASKGASTAPSPDLVFGAQISIDKLVEMLRPLVGHMDSTLRQEICLALLDDKARPVVLSHPGFQTTWKRPFVATEIGEALPHWEVAAYLLDPAKLSRSARMLELSLGLLIVVLLLAIGIGSWLIVADLHRQIRLARQKTDFVSNVSHELKTPLTSIRMFSELLAEGRVADPAKQRTYLGIITAETARLTRLINNVLDFSRLERGEKKYQFSPCDLAGLVTELAATYRPHLEAEGFRFECSCPEEPIPVRGDRDALAQVILNLLSNAEKYSDSGREIQIEVRSQASPLPHAEVLVRDRGLGVPRGCEEKIFDKFYRAHDSLSSGIQGSGLGLTLARQIARAHGGEVAYAPRPGGGSCFSLRLPLLPPDQQSQ